MDYDELFPGRFLKSGEFKGRKVKLTIKAIRLEQLPQDRGPDKTRGIVAFDETPKELVLNRTNGECIKAMFGRDTDQWIGKRLVLFPMPYQGDTAIRVWGSPDLDADLPVQVTLPRKRPFPMTMHAGHSRPVPVAEPELDDYPEAV